MLKTINYRKYMKIWRGRDPPAATVPLEHTGTPSCSASLRETERKRLESININGVQPLAWQSNEKGAATA